MAQPYDYRINLPDPTQSMMASIQGGLSVANAANTMRANQMAVDRQQQVNSAVSALMTKQNPTAADYVAVANLMPKEQGDNLRASWAALNKDQQASQLSFAGQVMAAFDSDPKIGIELLNSRAEAERNAGNEDQAKAYETWGKIAEANPSMVRHSIGLMVAGVPDGDKTIDELVKLKKAPGEVREVNAKALKSEYEAADTPERLAIANGQGKAAIRNIDSQIKDRSSRLALDRDKLQTETQMKLYELQQKQTGLDEGGRKLVNDSTIASVAASQSAGQMTDLANRLSAAGGGYGALGSASEWLKKATGNQDYMTSLRTEYVRLRNSQVTKMLPSGPASDKDIAIAMKGFPPETADSEQLSSFLRGMAKIQNYSATMEGAKAEWVNSVGHLGKPKQDIEVDGVKVPAGTTFPDFARQYMDAKAVKNEAATAQQGVSSRSYMRWAQ